MARRSTLLPDKPKLLKMMGKNMKRDMVGAVVLGGGLGLLLGGPAALAAPFAEARETQRRVVSPAVKMGARLPGRGLARGAKKLVQRPGRATRALRELAGVGNAPPPLQTAATIVGISTGLGAMGGLFAQGLEQAVHATQGLTRKLHYRRMIQHDPTLLEQFPEENLGVTYDVFHSLAPSLAQQPDIAARSVRSLLDTQGGIDWRNAQMLAQTQESINKSRALGFGMHAKAPSFATLPTEGL